MARKTVPVEYVVANVNSMLAAPDSTPDGREALCALVETLLMGVGRYGGFRYLTTAEAEGAGSRRFYMIKNS